MCAKVVNFSQPNHVFVLKNDPRFFRQNRFPNFLFTLRSRSRLEKKSGRTGTGFHLITAPHFSGKPCGRVSREAGSATISIRHKPCSQSRLQECHPRLRRSTPPGTPVFAIRTTPNPATLRAPFGHFRKSEPPPPPDPDPPTPCLARKSWRIFQNRGSG